MRNSEPDSKHFIESLDFLSIPCKNPQKLPKTGTAKQCFLQHVSPDLVDENRNVNDNDAQNLSMGPGKHVLSHSGVQRA